MTQAAIAARRLIGIDSAWVMAKHTSALAIGEIHASGLDVLAIHAAILGREALLDIIVATQNLAGVAIDGPLIINNRTGRRPGEAEVSRVYGGRNAGTHATNLGLYPDADTVWLSQALSKRGFEHASSNSRFQIECYPHPALIEMFGLGERLSYKRKRGVSVAMQREGQIRLATFIRSLSASPVLPLRIAEPMQSWLEPERIAEQRGQALKVNEDVLDSLLCVYICGLYALGRPAVFGSLDDGYVYVPQGRVD